MPEAIKQVADVFDTSNAEARYKKVKDRYSTIDRLITQAAEEYRAERERLAEL